MVLKQAHKQGYMEFGWPLSLFPGSEARNPYNFQSDRSVFVIHGRVLHNTPKHMPMR